MGDSADRESGSYIGPRGNDEMTENSDTETADSQPAARGALGTWVRQGARCAFLLRPDWTGLHATPSVIACLVLVQFGLALLIQRLYIDGPATFYWPSLQAGWLATAIMAWAAWLLVPRVREPVASMPPSAAALFAMVAAQSLTLSTVLAAIFIPLVGNGLFTPEVFGPSGWWAVTALAIGWVAAAQVKLLWLSAAPHGAPRMLASTLVLGMLVLNQWVLPVQHWYASRPDGAADEGPMQLTQEVMELQPELLARQLSGLQPHVPGTVGLYAITFAPYASENVFRRESAMVAGVMQDHFGAAGRTLQLVNHRDTLREWPWATPTNLQRAIHGMAKAMNRDQDVLFIHLTSHGARAGMLAAEFWPLSFDSVTPGMLKAWLDEAGIRHRVISVSACYSGSWVEPLAGPTTLVMTAADADHTSYGCGSRSDLTYFGRAMFDEELRRTRSFEEAFAAARLTIEKREKEAGKSDGFSNPQISVGADIRERLAPVAAEGATAAR
jgi:Peptidase C13 family